MASKLSTFFNSFIEKQVVNMMPVDHIQSRACHVNVGSRLRSASIHASASNRMLTAGDLMATGVIVNKFFLNVTYRTFNAAVFRQVLYKNVWKPSSSVQI